MNTLILMSIKPLQKIQKLGQRYENDERYRVIEVQDSLLAENYCKKYSPLVLVQFLTERSQIKDLVEICGNFYDEIERREIIILVMSFLNNSELNKKILNIGVKKIFDSDTKLETLWDEIEIHHRYLREKSLSLHIEEKQASIPEISKKKTTLILTEPLKCQYNYWQAEGRKSFRRLLGHWEIELLGPSLYTGSWVKRSTLNNKRTEYEWVYYNKEHDLFSGQEGKWIFFGDRPQLNADRWKFSGVAPELYYLENDSREYKILTKENGAVLEVASEVENRELKSRIYSTYRVQYSSDYENKKNTEKDDLLDLSEQYSEELFELVSDKKKIGQYLLEAQNEERNILIWTPHRQHKISAKIKYNNSNVEFELLDSKQSIEQSINFSNHKYLYSKIDLPKGLVFVPIKTPKVRDGRISVTKPDLVWKVQRRKWHRLNLESQNLEAHLGNDQGEQAVQITDVSAGGIRIQFSKNISIENVKQIKFKLNNKEIISEVELCWQNKNNVYSTLGLRYINLSSEVSRYINHFVLEKSKNYFDKYGEL